MPSELDMSPAEFRRLAVAVADLAAGYLAELPRLPIMPVTKAAEVQQLLREPLPKEPEDPETVLRIIRDTIFRLARHNGHPRFFGYVASPGTQVSALGDFLTGILNANVTSWRSAPGPAEIEHLVIDWIKQAIGYPDEAAGLFVSGGSMANFAGLAAMRAAKVPEARTSGMRAAGRLCIYVSEQGHFSIQKGAEMLGFGADAVRHLPVSERFRLDVGALEARIRQDLADGLVPACVVASAGTVSTGAVDPIEEIASVARRFGLWLHVDGAYGGFAAMAPSAAHLFRGLADADSLALDPHKWLYSSMGCGCVLYRDSATARAAFAHSADYTRPIGLAHDESFAFWDYGPELSRPFRALNVWLQFKMYGAEALAGAIDRNIQCAKYLERKILNSIDLEMLAPVALSIFCFRCLPPGFGGDLNVLNERILVALQRSGRGYLSNASLDGKFALRGCVLNHRTTEAEMDELLADIRNLSQEFCVTRV